MKSKNILYLGSRSRGRQLLLDRSSIAYQILQHDSDECVIDTNLSFAEYVCAIAQEKMKHLIVPEDFSSESPIFVLTADTLTKTVKSRQILGKPKDKEDAKRMLAILRKEPILVVTGCCLEKKGFKGGLWHVLEKKVFHVDAICEFHVPKEDEIEYFKKAPTALKACSSGIVEGFGQNFLKSVSGSYTTIVGLPLFEVRQTLKEIGFFG